MCAAFTKESFDANSLPSKEGDDFKYGEDEGDCGWWQFRPRWLQSLNTAGGFAWTQSGFLFVQGFLINGLFFVSLSTLEKRFNLTSTQSGSIISYYHLAYLLFSLFITFYANRAHRPQMLAIGSIVLGFGCFLFSLAHFTTNYYEYTSGRSDYCDPTNPEEECDDEGRDESNLSNYYWLFATAMFINGLGCVPLYTCGFSVIEDSLPSHKSGLYMGLVNSVTILGPTFGYICGGLLLLVYVDPKVETDLTPSDPRWVGAWWIGFLIATVLCWTVVAVPMSGFTKQIPGTAKQMAIRESEVHAKKGGTEILGDDEFGKSLKDLPLAFATMMKNPTFTFSVLASITEGFAVSGFAVFLPKIIENQFHLSAATAALLTGAIAVPGGIFGNIIAGLVLHRWDLRTKGALWYCILCCVAVVCLSPVALLYCEETQVSGFNTPYNISGNSNGYEDPCNAHCKCDDEYYAPVCGDDEFVYFTVCRAGCTGAIENENGTTYTNCSCVATESMTAIKGICPEPCNYLIPFLAVFFFIGMFNFMASTPSYLVTMRCVPDSQRTFAMGLHGFFYRFGSIPGPIVFGVAIDTTCILWQQLACDGGQGSCWIYDSQQMAIDVTLLGVSSKLGSTIFFCLALYFYVPPKQDELQMVSPGEKKNEEFSGKNGTYFENPLADEDQIDHL